MPDVSHFEIRCVIKPRDKRATRQHDYENGNASPQYDNGLFSAHDDVPECS